MKFVDEVSIRVKAGKGGDGCLSFHRGPNNPKGGPDGGDGGDGGDVVLVGSESLGTLIDFRYRPILEARNGSAGSSQQKRGAGGNPLLVSVPCGTTVVDDETLQVLGDIVSDGQQMIVAKGGVRGRGNATFKSSTNLAPRHTTKGTAGEQHTLRLQLKVLADVGLLGLPNAGKSTLISRISHSKPKIADYPFTTLVPNLGVVQVDAERSFVVADVPGLVPGASSGHGLGTRFLRHLSRSVTLLHLVDLAPIDGSDPIENVKLIQQELLDFSTAFGQKEIWIVGTKIDAISDEEKKVRIERLRDCFDTSRVLAISAVSGEGIDELVNLLGERLEDIPRDTSLSEHQEKLAADILNHELEEQRSHRTRQPEEDEVEVIYSNE